MKSNLSFSAIIVGSIWIPAFLFAAAVPGGAKQLHWSAQLTYFPGGLCSGAKKIMLKIENICYHYKYGPTSSFGIQYQYQVGQLS